MKKAIPYLLPFFLMLAIAPFTPRIDLTISKAFYDQGFSNNALFSFVYVWALIPGQLLIVGSLLALAMSYLSPKWKPLRQGALIIVLTAALGAGLICHTLLKDHWGRPRPRQLEEFGGTQAFRPFWSPNFFEQPEPSKSFPCGHCTMGFLFFAVAFIGWNLKKKWLVHTGLALALFLGIGLGLARIAQGGHFVSDVLMSALILWLTAYFVAKWRIN